MPDQVVDDILKKFGGMFDVLRRSLQSDLVLFFSKLNMNLNVHSRSQQASE